MSREQWTFVLVFVVLLLVLGIYGVLFYYRNVPKTRVRDEPDSDTEVVLDAIDGVRDQVDNHSQHTASEHEVLSKKLDTISGRTQWLVANDIAEGLAKERERAAAEEPKEDDHERPSTDHG